MVRLTLALSGALELWQRLIVDALLIRLKGRLVQGVVEAGIIARVVHVGEETICFRDVGISQIRSRFLSEIALHNGCVFQDRLERIRVGCLRSLSKRIFGCKPYVLELGKVGDVEVAGGAMKPDLRLWVDVKINTSVPELVSRAIILEVLECCESKLAFHRSHVVLDIVV